MNLAHLLDQSATAYPDRIAFINAEQHLSYQEFQQQSMVLAGGFKRLGVGKGDRVAIMLPNTLLFPSLVYAIWRLGAQLVTVNPLMKSQEVEYIIKVELSSWQMVIYTKIRAKESASLINSIGEIENLMMNNMIMQVLKICNHSYLFMDQYDISELMRSSSKFELLDRILFKLIQTDTAC